MFAGVVYGIPFAGFDSVASTNTTSFCGRADDFTFVAENYESFIVASTVVLIACFCVFDN